MTKSKKKKLNDEMDEYGLHCFDKEVEVLPENVIEWADLMGATGTLNKTAQYDEEFYTSLASMNDLGCSFKRIANTIEKEWENL